VPFTVESARAAEVAYQAMESVMKESGITKDKKRKLDVEMHAAWTREKKRRGIDVEMHREQSEKRMKP
jgi:hypothetical protein